MTACRRPPAGWVCSRPGGHDGPCPTSPRPKLIGDDARLVLLGASLAVLAVLALLLLAIAV